MKTLLIIVIGILSLSFDGNDRIVTWNENRRVTFDDYQGKVPLNPPGVAGSHVSIYCAPKSIDGKIVFITEAWLSKDTSWVLPAYRNDTNVLRHERVHFDITEVHARLLRKYIASFHGNYPESKEGADMMINHIDAVKLMEKSENTRYDVESWHGTNKEKQRQWEIDVAWQLRELEGFK
jgi:hypothetical protein